MATILVIGASRGIGLEFVRQYRAAGDRVIATARDDAGLQRLRDLGAEALRLDVTDVASASGLGWQLDGEKIDLALYVAGVYTRGGATEPPARAEFDRTMHTNVLGAMIAIPQVAPLVETAGGVFAVVSSEMGHIGSADSSYGWVYRASKAALNMTVASARNDYPAATLVLLNPGWVQTDMGGTGAPLRVEDSVAGMRRTLASLTPADSGGFFHHDGRRLTGW